MIRKIEEISMNAWPSLNTIIYDGWILRFANGVTRRSNSINPIYSSNFEIEEKLDYCESLYKECNLPVIYKLSNEVHPKNLDNILNNRGYSIDANTSVQISNFGDNNYKHSLLANFNENIKAKWIDFYIEQNFFNKDKIDTYLKILNNITLKKCFLILSDKNNIFGCALAVIQERFIGIFDVVVNENHRNKGYGKILINNILYWGKQNKADTAYLQVFNTNKIAINLYTKLGFKENYQYWYRILNI